jgi:type IV pilus assembly protein PilB
VAVNPAAEPPGSGHAPEADDLAHKLRKRPVRATDFDHFKIEFAPVPLHVTGDKEILNHARIVVHLLDGSIVHGKLVHYLAAHENMIVLHEPDLNAIEIPLDKVRYVLFRQQLTTPNASHPIHARTGEAVIPNSVQPYHVYFKDGAKLHGRTFTSSIDMSGLHFFQMVDDNHVARIFIPQQTIKSYHIGPLLGEHLIKTTDVTPEHIAEAMKQQEALRNKKLAEYPEIRAALNSEDLKKILKNQSSYIISGEHNIPLIGEMLLEEHLVTREQLDEALTEQKKDRSKKIGQLLVEMGAISTETLHIALAHKLSIPFVKLREFDFPPNVFKLLPVDIAHKHLVVPLFIFEDRLVIAMDDPSHIETIDLLRFITGRNLELTIATKEDIEWVINNYYSIEEYINEDLTAAEEQLSGGMAELNEQELNEIMRLGKEKPIVHLVNSIITDAIRRRASDIHIRPQEQRVDLLLRVDGSMIKIRSFSKGLLPAISSRIKIIGKMNIAERRLPQDGRARVNDRNETVDLRISVMPSINGESIVIRLLNVHVGLKSVSDLGFNMSDEERFVDLLHKNNGIFFVTGPTGSGKSTTLYAALKEVINQNVNIITVEDPVEYHIDGITQIQVHSQIGYTFARALRQILRHDPDVIMVGEVRDEETAKIAVESALTGHLVLSTLHTNDAASAIARMLEMGIEAYMLGPTVLGILAQRLVRRNCPHCADIENVAPHVRKLLNVAEDEVFYKGVGCDNCNHTGFNGRLAVYELLMVTPKMRELIERRAGTEEVYHQALLDGMTQLTKHALDIARQRKTSLSEVYRVRLE